ncbi:hypothetical protein SH139x_000785 [Planctomycetaceae bacterium SH139]
MMKIAWMLNKSRLSLVATIGCLYLAASIVNATTGQSPQRLGGERLGGEGFNQQQFNEQEEMRASLETRANRGGESGTVGEAVPQLTPMVAGEGFLAFATADGAGGQLVTLIHGESMRMVVHRVSAEGEIKFLSSRPLKQDFEVQYNVTEPTPAAIERLMREP